MQSPKFPTHPQGNRPGRSEQEVLDDLKSLCTQPGYVHAVAYLCFRDNILIYDERVGEEQMRDRIHPSALIRTEISILLGMMIKAPLDWTLPPPDTMQEYIEASDRLLQELHDALSAAFSLDGALAANEHGEQLNPFDSGAAMREPIFYAAESAYNFQYVDLAAIRYAADADWLQTNYGFTIAQACAVAEAADRFLTDRFPAALASTCSLRPEQWTMLPAFCLTPAEIAAYSGLDPELVETVLLAFTVPVGETNSQFEALQDFNQIAAAPLLRLPSGEFLSLQNYALAEAIYNSPFYWMQADKAYWPTRDRNRGEFTETFVAQRLAAVFGADRVLTNIDIWQGRTKIGEIDVLVLWADRAIIVQAKSKRLTVEARKGNDQVIRDDFKKSVQDAYDQGLTCAECIGDTRFRFAGADGTDVKLPAEVTEVFVFCVVSDHYPALSFQTRQFLKTRVVPRVQAALVTDIFLIDVLTELLPTPLQLLSYVARRARYGDRILASSELSILAYHLNQNLWLDDKVSMLHIADDFTPGVDVAMAVRRRQLPGAATPDGFMTRLEGKSLGRIVRQIESSREPAMLDQGFQMLELSGDAFDGLSRLIDQQTRRAARDGQPHDVMMMFDDRSGFTAVFSSEPDEVASLKLATMCARRKYRHKSDRWFGMCLTPGDAQLRFGLRISEPWEQDDSLDAETAGMKEPLSPKAAYERVFRGAQSTPKVGRNSPCPCSSGRKWKQCCLNK